MSVENVKAFFKRLEEDEVFRNDFAQNKSIEKGNTDSMLKAAAEAGYPFTTEELGQAQAEAKDAPLSEAQLEKVAGGAGLGVCVVIGYGYWAVGSDLNGHAFEDQTREGLGVCLIIGAC